MWKRGGEVVLSNNLKKHESFVNYLYSQNIEIANGKFLFKLLAPNVLNYITSKTKKQNLKIAIAANDIDRIALGAIKEIASNYNNLSIVTRRVNRVKKLQNDFYEKNGVIITVTSNQRKALSKTNIILNFDFPEENLNKFNIYEKAIIVNFENKVKISKKSFNGINIQDYEISMKKSKLKELVMQDRSLIEIFSKKDIYEANLYKEQSYETLRKNLKQDNVIIKFLYGNKGRKIANFL